MRSKMQRSQTMEVETLEKFVCELIRSLLLINDAIKTNTALS